MIDHKRGRGVRIPYAAAGHPVSVTTTRYPSTAGRPMSVVNGVIQHSEVLAKGLTTTQKDEPKEVSKDVLKIIKKIKSLQSGEGFKYT